jgi:hypothetical protein
VIGGEEYGPDIGGYGFVFPYPYGKYDWQPLEAISASPIGTRGRKCMGRVLPVGELADFPRCGDSPGGDCMNPSIPVHTEKQPAGTDRQVGPACLVLPANRLTVRITSA